MTQKNINNKQVKYDADHDVLHIFLSSFAPAFDDEDYPGIVIKRAVDDERITGIVIMDYKKRDIKELSYILPRYNFKMLNV
ncbi:MAG: hypothetical protein CVU87_02755 [Firmicutes bacterium HGW-Firmicutes-12]|jgi:hypothetical protein|nr:MAG: hypothetical protein CVU87_02755 [Firmicutes bacterium HGW-Firmicutes-12]